LLGRARIPPSCFYGGLKLGGASPSRSLKSAIIIDEEDKKTPDSTLDTQLDRIHHGDCVAGMQALPEGSVDLIFADPPFNIGYDYDVYKDKKEYQQYLDWSRDWISCSASHA